MSRIAGVSVPFLLGLEGIERMLDRRAADGYPPFNIERRPPEPGRGPGLRIVMAVAGFGREEIEVAIDGLKLTVRGRQTDEPGRVYLHRGIAARQFQRSFLLAEGMEVLGADLADGLLTIDLARPTSGTAGRRIDISGR